MSTAVSHIVRQTFEPRPESIPPAARDMVVELLTELGWSQMPIDKARLVISELATNTVFATADPVRVDLLGSGWWHGSSFRDWNPLAQPVMADAMPDRLGGLETAVGRCDRHTMGVDISADSKAIWCTIDASEWPGVDAAAAPVRRPGPAEPDHPVCASIGRTSRRCRSATGRIGRWITTPSPRTSSRRPSPIGGAGRARTPARALRDAVEPIATIGWWSRSAADRMGALGHDFFDGYVWGRAAALGADVAPVVVVAAFGAFEPTLLTAVLQQGRSYLHAPGHPVGPRRRCVGRPACGHVGHRARHVASFADRLLPPLGALDATGGHCSVRCAISTPPRIRTVGHGGQANWCVNIAATATPPPAWRRASTW